MEGGKCKEKRMAKQLSLIGRGDTRTNPPLPWEGLFSALLHSDLHSAVSDDRQSVPKEPRAESHLLLHFFYETLTTIVWLKET